MDLHVSHGMGEVMLCFEMRVYLVFCHTHTGCVGSLYLSVLLVLLFFATLSLSVCAHRHMYVPASIYEWVQSYLLSCRIRSTTLQHIRFLSLRDVLYITYPCLSFLLSRTGPWLASGSRDNTIRVWHTSTGNCEFVLQGHRQWICGMLLLPGDFPRTKCVCNSLFFCCLTFCSCLYRFVHFTDGLLATAARDSTVRLWEWQNGKCVKELASNTKIVSLAAINGEMARPSQLLIVRKVLTYSLSAVSGSWSFESLLLACFR